MSNLREVQKRVAMSLHIETKHRLQSIPKVSTFIDLIESSTLNQEDKQIVKLLYLQNKTLSYVADTMGYSESTIKRKHRKILSKLEKLL